MSTQLFLGPWQREAYYSMLHDGFRPTLRGKARYWSGTYHRSLNNLLTRMRAAGYTITLVPGPRGGTSFGQATYIATPPVD